MNRIILIVLPLFFFSVNCDVNRSEYIIIIRALNEDTRKPEANLEIIVNQITKPLLSKQGRKEIVKDNLNSKGEFSFRARSGKEYSIGLYDSQNNYMGGLHIDTRILKEKEFFIYCKKVSKLDLLN